MRILPPSGSRSKAENIIRDCIKNLPSKSSEIALWSVHVPEHATKEFSEVDFILLTQKGICCIEVKGGRVEYTNGSFILPRTPSIASLASFSKNSTPTLL